MTKRREFSKAIKVAVIKRATRDGVVYCEACHALAKRWQIDHVRPDGLLGEPVLANAMLICEPCWRVKNPADTTAIAKAKRREARHVGAKSARQQIASNPHGLKAPPKPGRVPKQPSVGMPSLARRYGAVT